MLELIKDSIIFAFEDKVAGNNFTETSATGIYLGKDNHRAANSPRWGRVIAVGPEVDAVKQHDRILIEPTMWTIGMEHDGITLWRTAESHVLCIDR